MSGEMNLQPHIFFFSFPPKLLSGGELQVEGSLHSLFLPTLYIMYPAITHKVGSSRRKILPLNTASKIKIRKGAQGAAINSREKSIE